MPTSPYLSPREASDYLKGQGLFVAPRTLNKYRCVGGGPEFVKFGRAVRYSREALDAWRDAKLSPPRRNTSETAGARGAA